MSGDLTNTPSSKIKIPTVNERLGNLKEKQEIINT